MASRIQHLRWATNCVKAVIAGKGRNYLRLARWHIRHAVTL